MTKAQIIDKYIQRIMVDYPEADKIHIDLVQFAEELRQCDVSGSLPLSDAQLSELTSLANMYVWESNIPNRFYIREGGIYEVIKKYELLKSGNDR